MSRALDEDAGGYAAPEEEPAAREILTFRLGSESFGIQVVHVREVLDFKPIARVSNAPSALLGMVDVRGVGVPVVDLKRKLRMPESESAETSPDTRIVVLDFMCGGRHQTVAVVADAVHEVTDFGDDEIEAAPQFGQDWNSSFMKGLGRRNGGFLTLLEIDQLFEIADFSA